MTAQFYVVGGAVRDALLGLPASDRDWVAVGATPQQLLDLGYRAVGKDFPVFLHPQTHEEVALARTERKTGPGYRGFSFHAAPEVTLEEDLARRDLTINAIARTEDGALIDPFGGQADLRARVLRHVSPAFVEDPVRLLRLARLAARFADFSVAPETLSLLREMVKSGEVDALMPERVWQELAKGLLAARPSRMLDLLQDCGALARLLPELSSDVQATGLVLDRAAGLGSPVAVAWACLMVAGGATAVSANAASVRLKAPAECKDLAILLAREHALIGRAASLSAEELVSLFQRCDAFRRAARFERLLQAARLLGHDPSPLPALLEAGSSVDAAALAHAAQHQAHKGQALADAIVSARIQAVALALHKLN